MNLSPRAFDVPKDQPVKSLIARLRARLRLRGAPAKSARRDFYDTFDWRLFAKGLQLECEQSGVESTYYLSSLADGKIKATVNIPANPRFVWDFPPGALKRQLDPVIGMRALLPMVSIHSELHAFDLLNHDDKTVAHVRMEENRVVKPDGGSKRLPSRINVYPVKGYLKSLEKRLKVLSEELQLPASDNDMLRQALTAIDKQPGDYSSKPHVVLDPNERADAATKQILLQLLQTMQRNESGTLEDLDSEFLHDFRVSVRRTRSALSQVKKVFPQTITEKYKKEFAWLGGVTGPTRDLDVYLLQFDEYRASVPADIRGALDPLYGFLQKQQTREHGKMARALQSARYKRLLQGWEKFLQTPVPARPTAPNAARPITEVARERTWRMFKRVMKEGRAITDTSPPKDLHELRKSCKKLRYLMEFFHSIYPPAKIAKLIKALKQLQNNLGEFQDLHVQIESLKQFSEQMSRGKQAPPQTLIAIGALIKSLDRRQQLVRESFYESFEAFSREKYQDLGRKLFVFDSS